MSARERAALAAAEERPQQALAWALIDLADAVRSLQRAPSEVPGPEPRRYLTEEQRAQMTAYALERLEQVRDSVGEDQADEHVHVWQRPPGLPSAARQCATCREVTL